MHRRLGDNGLFAAAVLSSPRSQTPRGSRENIALRRDDTRSLSHRPGWVFLPADGRARALARSIDPPYADASPAYARNLFPLCRRSTQGPRRYLIVPPWKRLLRKRFRKLRTFLSLHICVATIGSFITVTWAPMWKISDENSVRFPRRSWLRNLRRFGSGLGAYCLKTGDSE